MNVLDLFCGCGGLSYGFEKAGFDIVLGIDNDKKALETFAFNHNNAKTLCGDLTQITADDIRKIIGDTKIDVIIGGPPCQGMSLSGPRKFDDPRNSLYLSYIRLVNEISPEAVVLENVPGLASLFDGQIEENLLKRLSDLGYTVTKKILCAADYGVPQSRRRIIFVGMRDKEYVFPKSSNVKVTCKDALSDLPPLEDTLGDSVQSYALPPQNEYQKLMRKNSCVVKNHIAAVHSEKVRKIISLVPDGGNYKDLPEPYKSSRNFHIAWTRFNSEKPAPTIDTGHRHHFHYKYNRVPTVRECARLQSFPDDFIFFGNKTEQFRQVGNAVPPLLAQAVAENLKERMNQNIGEEKMYKVPDEYYFRIHHVRPRFKTDIENVLLYMASEISKLKELPEYEFAAALNGAIKRYPGNTVKTLKTINNWRTEISALFGFLITENGYTRPGRRALELAEKEDLVEAFKVFLYSFQYPGAHIKPQEVAKQIQKGVRFKPAQYILRVYGAAEKLEGRRIGLTKGEICHCIFNDLRCTTGAETPEDTWKRIKQNRSTDTEYDMRGDVIRYAGDIIDYMETANLLVSHDSRVYYTNTLENQIIMKFVNSKEWFGGYDKMIENGYGSIKDIEALAPEWYRFVNRQISYTDFATDILAFISSDSREYEALQANREQTFADILDGDGIKTKDIGDMGESLVHTHECQRIKSGGRPDLVHLIKRIPTSLAAGYDIQSVELDGKKRYIEVKTTISSKPLHFNKLHMTPNEWNTASSIKDRYFIYRLFISKNDKKLFIIQDPVGLYKDDKIEMIPKDGAEIAFDTDKAGIFEDLLSWTN